MVDVYHELAFPYEVMHSLIRALKPGGRVVLVEYRGGDPAVPIKPLHKMTEAQVRRELSALPLTWERTSERLPMQHIIVFTGPSCTSTAILRMPSPRELDGAASIGEYRTCTHNDICGENGGNWRREVTRANGVASSGGSAPPRGIGRTSSRE
jgi:hypothetical protein